MSLQLISIDKAVKTDIEGVLDLTLTVVGLGPKVPYTYDPNSMQATSLAIKAELLNNPITIENPVALPIEELKTEAKASVVEFADWVTDTITSKYPKAEQMGWDRKSREAEAFLTGTGDLADAPTLTNLVQLQLPTATNEEILAAVNAVSTSIRERAAVFTGIADYVELLRKATDLAIDSATTGAEIDIILTTAKADAVAKTSAFGIILPE